MTTANRALDILLAEGNPELVRRALYEQVIDCTLYIVSSRLKGTDISRPSERNV
jgi:hypothetical protein